MCLTLVSSMSVPAHARAWAHTRTHARTHTLMHARKDAFTHVRPHACAHTRARAPTRTHEYARVHAHIHTRTRTRARANAHTHTHPHAHTHTHADARMHAHAPRICAHIALHLRQGAFITCTCRLDAPSRPGSSFSSSSVMSRSVLALSCRGVGQSIEGPRCSWGS